MVDDKAIIKQLISDKDKLRGWGTSLDDEKSVPSAYIGKSFYQANHEDIGKFMSLPDIEKWKMAYWIERQSEKNTVRKGVIIGFILGGIVLYIVLSFLGR